MDHNLSGLSTREFEHVSQALAQAILGPGVSVFGDGRDGGREATFEGRVPYPSELDAWDGYGVVQAKFRQRTDQQPQDAVSWLKGQVKEELEAWLSPASKRERLPEYLIFTTNVILTPVPGSGGIAQIEQFVSTYAARLGLKGWAVWSYDQLCRYLDRYDSIRRTYAGAITSGDVLAQLRDAVSAGHKSRSDALTVATRASQYRREARLSLGPEERVDAVLDWADKSSSQVVTVPVGTLAVLVAPMGAGKSEEAENWWREGLREAAGDPDAVIPVWVDAGKAVPDLLDAITRAGGEPPSGLGRIVIDDLDRLSPEQVAQLLYEARLLLAAHPTARILATCRPGIELGRAVVHEVALWPVRRGAELLDLVVGDDGRILFKEREVQDLLTSPLQVLSVASRLLAGEDARVSSLKSHRPGGVRAPRPSIRYAAPPLGPRAAARAAQPLSRPSAKDTPGPRRTPRWGPCRVHSTARPPPQPAGHRLFRTKPLLSYPPVVPRRRRVQRVLAAVPSPTEYCLARACRPTSLCGRRLLVVAVASLLSAVEE